MGWICQHQYSLYTYVVFVCTCVYMYTWQITSYDLRQRKRQGVCAHCSCVFTCERWAWERAKRWATYSAYFSDWISHLTASASPGPPPPPMGLEKSVTPSTVTHQPSDRARQNATQRDAITVGLPQLEDTVTPTPHPTSTWTGIHFKSIHHHWKDRKLATLQLATTNHQITEVSA